MVREEPRKEGTEKLSGSSFLEAIDRLNLYAGKAAAWLFLPLTLLIVYDVFLRYVLDDPTIWAWDVNVQLMGAFVALGGGYTLLHGGHVSVDVLTSKMKPQKRAVLDAVTSFLSILGLGVLLWRVAIYAWQAVVTQEHFTSTWYPPIYPLKLIIAFGIGAMFLQAIATFIRRIHSIRTQIGV